jgi:hypothetical protein
MPRKRYKPDRRQTAAGGCSGFTGTAGRGRRSRHRRDRGHVMQMGQEFDGLRTDQVKWMEELEAENAQLRRAISDLTLDDPREGCKGKLLSPARRGSCIAIQVESARATGPPCARTATTCRVPTGRDDEERLTADIVELAHRINDKTGRAHLAVRGAESSRQATQARPAVALGWICVRLRAERPGGSATPRLRRPRWSWGRQCTNIRGGPGNGVGHRYLCADELDSL